MTRKAEAFKAFDAGKRPRDLKWLAKPKTLYNYFQLWKNTKGEVSDDPIPEPKLRNKNSVTIIIVLQ